jgi:Receptor family ligand binding region
MKIATTCTIAVLVGTYFKLSEAQVLQPGNACKVMTFIPFSDLNSLPLSNATNGTTNFCGYGYWPDNTTLAKAAFSLMAAAELARHHFNTRNTSIVPELGELGHCNITMPDPNFYEILYINSGYTKVYAQRQFHDTRFILNQFSNQGLNNGGGKVDVGSLINGRPSQNSSWLPTNDQDFCAIVGPVLPSEVAGIYSFAESGKIPMIAYETISSKFSSQKEYMSFARILPEVNDFGTIIAYALRDIWHREAIGILYDSEDFGEELERPLQVLKDLYGYETVRAPFTQFQERDAKDALLDIRAKGIRTIIVLSDRAPAIDVIAQVADDEKMLGSGYFWLLMGAAFRPSLLKALKHKVDSPTNKLLRGAALFTNYDRPTYYPDRDPFLKHWKTQKLLSIESLNRLQPLTNEDKPFYSAKESYFEDEVPSEYASYVYDAIILAGISACRSFNACPTYQYKDFRHIQELVKTEFQGASGPVRFKHKKYVESIPTDPICDSTDPPPATMRKPVAFERLNGRDPKDITFGIYNIRPGSIDSSSNQGYVYMKKSMVFYLFCHTLLLHCLSSALSAMSRF